MRQYALPLLLLAFTTTPGCATVDPEQQHSSDQARCAG